MMDSEPVTESTLRHGGRCQIFVGRPNSKITTIYTTHDFRTNKSTDDGHDVVNRDKKRANRQRAAKHAQKETRFNRIKTSRAFHKVSKFAPHVP